MTLRPALEHRALRAWPLAIVLSLALAACGGDDPAQLKASAREHIAKNEYPAAIIQLKNALQKQPESGEARLMLGEALLATGDVAGAESELRKASEQAATADKATALLARAMVLQGQHKKVDDTYRKTQLKDKTAQADLWLAVADARMGLGQNDRAREAVDAALEASPGHAAALVARARLLASAGKFDEAQAVLAQVLQQHPSDAAALKFQGDLLFYGLNQPDKALPLYEKALAARPSFHEARAGVVRVHLRMGRLDEAVKTLQQLKAVADGQSPTLLLEGQIAMLQGDLKAARAAAQKLLKKLPDNAWALELAGVIEYQAGALVQAEPLLEKAVSAAPDANLARRTLIQVQLRKGDVQKALSLLPEGLDASKDASLLGVAAQAYLVSGNAALAQRYFEKAATLDPQDPEKKTQLALSKMANGQAEQVLDELRDIAAKDQGVVADMALINTLAQQRKPEQALQAIGKLEAKKPNDPIPPLLRAQVLRFKGDVAEARKVLERAQQAHPSFLPHVTNLAQLDLLQKQPQVAQSRMEAFVKGSPKNVQAILELAELRQVLGAKPDEVESLLRRAVEAGPDDVRPRLALITLLLRQQKSAQALTAAQEAAAVFPTHPGVLDGLGQSQAAKGEHNQALSTFGKLAALQPKSAEPHMRIAAVHAAVNNLEAAAQSLRKALEIQPELASARQGLAGLALRKNDMAEALGVVRKAQALRPKDPMGHMMEGDVHVFARKWDAAIQSFQKAVQLGSGTPAAAIKLHGAYLGAQRKADAEKFAAEWTARNPREVAFVFYLGSQAMSAKDLPLAEKHFRKALDIQPNNPVALNNLAWVQGRQGKDEAVANIERANTLAPDNADILDTWASLLERKQQWGRAIELQEKAVQLEPKRPDLKLTLARLRLRGGDLPGARILLQELKQLGTGFGGHAEVATLTQELQKLSK